MSSIGTFGSFTQARLGIYAAQMGMSVTGNNIANINTPGYTRQKLNQESMYTSGTDRYYSSTDVRVGQGVFCTGVSQLRDPYLDIRFRDRISDVSAMDAKLATLQNIQDILDEVGDGKEGFGVIEAQLDELRKALNQLTDQTGHADYDTQVRAAAEALCKKLNSYSVQLDRVEENVRNDFNQNVKAMNTILTNIRDLNTSIREAEIHGDQALELRDRRNTLIDQLSEYVKIDVKYTEEDIGAGRTVEKLQIRLGDRNPDGSVHSDEVMLVDGIYSTQFGINQLPTLNPAFDPNQPNGPGNEQYLDKEGNPTEVEANAKMYDDPRLALYVKGLRDKEGMPDPDAVEALKTQKPDAMYPYPPYDQVLVLDDNDLYGALQSQREFLTESGEFSTKEDLAIDENAASKRGIKYYQNSLDMLARQVAKAFNQANNGFLHNEKGEFLDANGNPIDVSDYAPPKVFDENGAADPKGGFYHYTDAAGQPQTISVKEYNKLVAQVRGGDTGVTLPQIEREATPVELKPGTSYTPEQEAYLREKGAKPMGGNLFSNHGDTNNDADITAGNICIAKKWYETSMIVPSYEQNSVTGEIGTTDSSNILHMVSLFEKKMDYDVRDLVPDAATDVPLFNGSFQQMWVNIGSTLGNDMKITSTLLDVAEKSAVELDGQRMSVSSVDLNDEAMNLMQYSKSYNAACRLMTTLDTMLDKLINGTGMTT